MIHPSFSIAVEATSPTEPLQLETEGMPWTADGLVGMSGLSNGNPAVQRACGFRRFSHFSSSCHLPAVDEGFRSGEPRLFSQKILTRRSNTLTGILDIPFKTKNVARVFGSLELAPLVQRLFP